MMHSLAVASMVLSWASQTTAAFVGGLSYNGQALTPQMGWDTYNAYGLGYNETIVTTNAQRIVDLGLRDLGYTVIILDDAMTEQKRAPNGSLVANATKFPSGLPALGEQLHSLGLLFGMYSSAGKFTCGGYPGGLGYEIEDAQFFASVGADYLKYDNCYNEGLSGTPKLSQDRYAAMSNALNSTGRNFTYSLCNWGDDKPWEWASTIANSARISGDVFDAYDMPTTACPCGPDQYYCEIPGYTCSVLNILGKASYIVSKNQPGYWNDLDMLEVGNGAMTYDEYKTHFSMWAAIKSPLIMGNDLSTISPDNYAILVNAAVIALNQDPSGSAINRRVVTPIPDATDAFGFGETQIWQGSLANGDQVVALLNAANTTQTISSSLVDIFGGLSTGSQAKSAWDVYDLWGNQTVMPTDTAAAVLNGTMSVAEATGYYNASANPFATALAGNVTDPRLTGTYLTRVEAGGTLSSVVPRHGVGLFRLKPVASGRRKRDEL